MIFDAKACPQDFGFLPNWKQLIDFRETMEKLMIVFTTNLHLNKPGTYCDNTR